MTSQQILQSDFLDILFERRNKSYGAYRLRREYNLNLLKAIGGTSLLVVALLFFSGASGEQSEVEKPDEGLIMTSIVLPGDIKREVPKPKIQPPAAPARRQQTEVFLDKIKVVNELVNPVATIDKLEKVAIGNTTIFDGPAGGFPNPQHLPALNGDGGTENKVEKAETPLPSRQPQFPGGVEAWLDFLNRHLRPPVDLEPGEKRMSLIRFSVDEQGVVTNFHVTQSGGSEFDNEVIRVLKKMPRWLPALQSGKPVAVSFTQPVSFVAAAE